LALLAWVLLNGGPYFSDVLRPPAGNWADRGGEAAGGLVPKEA